MPTSRSQRRPPKKTKRALDELLAIMARLRAPDGCPWDREQTHRTLRLHAVEEVYELIDAIEADDDPGIEEELGDLLLQVVFHCQLGNERSAFDFESVAKCLVTKLIHRHPHVFGQARARTAATVLAQWDRLKQAEKQGTGRERTSALDGIPRHLPALLRAQKLWRKAVKAGLTQPAVGVAQSPVAAPASRPAMAAALFELAARCQDRGWAAEDLLRTEAGRRERAWRRAEARGTRRSPPRAS
jgi:uncharacterized protein YabN with tetrapyrrole methylase and pyrophosphatase domain